MKNSQLKIQKFLEDGMHALSQTFALPFLLIFDIILRPKIERPENFKVFRGTLILANHQSRIDPLLLSSHVGLLNVFRILPIRYPVASKYMRIPVLGTILKIFGGYDIGTTTVEKAKKLLYTRELIRSGYTVLLFPEGRMVREGEAVIEFQKGAEWLLTENTPVLLARVSGMNTWSWFDVKRKTQVSSLYSDVLVDIPVEEKMNYLQKFFVGA